jgi:hypothetical protein
MTKTKTMTGKIRYMPPPLNSEGFPSSKNLPNYYPEHYPPEEKMLRIL